MNRFTLNGILCGSEINSVRSDRAISHGFILSIVINIFFNCHLYSAVIVNLVTSAVFTFPRIGYDRTETRIICHIREESVSFRVQFQIFDCPKKIPRY